MYTRLLVIKTKLVIKLLRFMGKNASALPGLIVETLSPTFLERVLKPVEGKIVIVTGTNGKTTSTRMLVHALRSAGDRVVTNSTGSNMTRGLISALLDDMTKTGKLKTTDWFVFEMDEAYAPIFTKKLKIHSVLALNVLRDQLDRYGEIDTTAKLIESSASCAKNFVYNQQDPLLKAAAGRLSKQGVSVVSFGVVKKLTYKLRNEQNMYAKGTIDYVASDFELSEAEISEGRQVLAIKHKQEQIEITIPLEGFHNAVNVTGVCALLSELNKEKCEKMAVAINTMEVPFGRGEVLSLNNKTVTVALVKNPSGFSHNLETFVTGKATEYIIFAINDKLADGRDVSWLWDINFRGVVSENTRLQATGIRAYDMAVRLKHDGLKSDVEPDIDKAVAVAMKSDANNIVIIPTYTALYEVRSVLTKYGKVPRIW